MYYLAQLEILYSSTSCNVFTFYEAEAQQLNFLSYEKFKLNIKVIGGAILKKDYSLLTTTRVIDYYKQSIRYLKNQKSLIKQTRVDFQDYRSFSPDSPPKYSPFFHLDYDREMIFKRMDMLRKSVLYYKIEGISKSDEKESVSLLSNFDEWEEF